MNLPSRPSVMSRGFTPLALLLIASLLAGCDPEGGSTDLDALEPYVLKGTVRDSAGEPLGGVRVYAYNTLLWDSFIVGMTDADGLYRLELDRNLTTSYQPEAYLPLRWNGGDWLLPLDPDNRNPFGHSTGAVRHFTWRLQGERGHDLHYGATVIALPHAIENWAFMDRVELDFVPTGPRIDGSTGEAFTLRLVEGLTHKDIPVGNYRISARDIGQDPVPLLVRLYQQPEFSESVEARFDHVSNSMNIDVTTR